MEIYESILEDEKYISVLYSEQRRPKNCYPEKLAAYLRDHHYNGPGSLIDIGCGRGDMLKALHSVGFTVTGTDISPVSIDICKPYLVKIANFENEPLPFDDNTFSNVFSKSVIEHLHNPMPLLKQSLRVLENEGTAVIMTPSWMHHGWGPFYLDYTHVTPFTKPSLYDAMVMAGFKDVEVIYFHQLPFLWKRPWLTPFIQLFAQLPLRYRPMYDTKIPLSLNKFFRFSKEVMLLGIGHKQST
jgi:SAM-dependent methyltransferase